MAEYIKREALSKKIRESDDLPHMKLYADTWLYCVEAADVAPVVHGRWEDASWNNFWQTMTATCSNCNERGEVRVKRNELGEIVINSPCCPNCGARMDGE